jgi:hypothetical protein
MTKRLVHSSSAAALASAAILASVPAFGQEAPLPAPNVGDVWRFRRIDLWTDQETSVLEYRLVRLTPDRLVLENSATRRKLYRTRDANPCRRPTPGEEQVCAGPFRFPLKVGNRHRYEDFPSSDRQVKLWADCVVAAREQVSVPAGSFDAYRIECDGTWTPVSREPLSGRWSETVWYAPAVHWWVKQTLFNRTWTGVLQDKTAFELIEYRHKRD